MRSHEFGGKNDFAIPGMRTSPTLNPTKETGGIGSFYTAEDWE